MMIRKWIKKGKQPPSNRQAEPITAQNKLADRNRGEWAEHLACQWLQQHGLLLIERNYRCRQGEIDIVMRDGTQLSFVEVRLRSPRGFGDAAASVDWRKQQKLQKAAAHYLAHHRQFSALSCRFDVMAAQVEDGDGKLRWQWIKDAFYCTD